MQVSAQCFQKIVLNWYHRHGRKHLPWQQNISPYRVWLSEIMLQQTQVNTVIPYFKIFIKHFPTLKKLAEANSDEVLSLWSGLGYYSRARNLHRCAQIIQQDFKGEFPDTLKQLIKLPGIGRSTAGAILALSMEKQAAILDGNVKRVLTRVFCISGWPDSSATNKKLWQLAEKLTPEEQCREYTQAMMDLGAMICTRSKPQCSLCPLNNHCQAYAEDKQTTYPEKKPKKTLPVKTTYLLIMENQQQQLLLEKRPPTGIWGGLWSFPEIDDPKQLSRLLKKDYGLKLTAQKQGQTFRHTFSHFHLEITPLWLKTTNTKDLIMESTNRIWYKDGQVKVGLPKPIKQLIDRYSEGDLT